MGDLGAEESRWLGALWGKSAQRAGGRVNLLLSHLLDTAAVAELIWDHYLAPSVKRMLDELAGGPGEGRKFFSWLCGVHDCGKATPAFQSMDSTAAAAVQAAGLTWNRFSVGRAAWRHDRAGGRLLRRLLKKSGWDEEQVDWVWPLVAGHHGLFPPVGGLRPPNGHVHGKGAEWERAQDALVMAFTRALGYTDLNAVQPRSVPSRATQLQLSGFVVMADWIASDERHFPGIDTLAKVSLASARTRAAAAWKKLGLRGGWGVLPVPAADAFRERFGEEPRPSQSLVQDVAGRMGGPGLMVIEAPMGEGKTKAALLAAEILAARFGADGVFVGMPTQATSDPMFSNVRRWLGALDVGVEGQVALLHGKRMFNPEWRRLLGEEGDHFDDRYGSVLEDEDDPYGLSPSGFDGDCSAERRAPAEWFLGRRRGLLSPFVVGTIDQLLFAATRTKHVMLRMAGLAGKVVILDEVHAADVYMSQFLMEGLRWLGQAGVPVILLSATLPPEQRRSLVACYLAGAASREETDVDVPEPAGYPNVTAAWLEKDEPVFLVESSPSWRPDLAVRVEVLPEPEEQVEEVSPGDAAVRELLDERLAAGGCVLIIRNTVARAQATYETLWERYGDQVRLLHGRLHAAHRADRTAECLALLGPGGDDRSARPERLIIVATQIAEESFDIDADLLITDLAPIDLLLQRIGRLHRQQGTIRPERLRAPQVVVTGFEPRSGRAPRIRRESKGIYGSYLLLRTAALVLERAGRTWAVPGDVPELVAAVYDADRTVVPAEWADTEREAYAEWERRQRRRAESAEPFLLTRFGEHENRTLDGLHYGGSSASLSDRQFQALVRDGDPSIEVVMVRHDGRGYRTLAGRWLGINGEVSADLVDEVLGSTVRLPPKLTAVAESELVPLDGWRDHPWLRYSRALLLDEENKATLGEFDLRYDDDLGLVVTGGPSQRAGRSRE